MESELRRSMFRYYDERAPEYEEAYLLGTGTASIPAPGVFQAEALLLGDIVERFAHGRIIDVACGTAYWLPRYAGQCSQITLLDQSERMLDESKRKATTLGVLDRCSIIRTDFFDYQFTERSHDAALIGFLLSHLTDAQERIAFTALKAMLADNGDVLILDSAWSAQRARFNAKVERQGRRLNDGTPFEIYKRYFNEQDILRWATTYDVTVSIEHFGVAFFAASCRFGRDAPVQRSRQVEVK